MPLRFQLKYYIVHGHYPYLKFYVCICGYFITSFISSGSMWRRTYLLLVTSGATAPYVLAAVS